MLIISCIVFVLIHQDNQRIKLLDDICCYFRCFLHKIINQRKKLTGKIIIIISFTHLNCSISRSCDKPLIPRLHSDGSHPAKMTTDDLSDKTYYC